jgi:hypothetical protein
MEGSVLADLGQIDPKSINDDAGFRRFTRLRRGRGNRAPDDQTQGHVVLAIASRTCGFPHPRSKEGRAPCA